MDRRRGMGVGETRINMGQAHRKGDGGGTPLMGGSTTGDTRTKGGGALQSGQFPPGGHMPRDWRIGWTDDRHPKIKSMMQKYLEQING